MTHLNYKLYNQQLHLKYWCNLARYWLQAAWGWHDRAETCSSVIICEIIVHLLVRVQNKAEGNALQTPRWEKRRHFVRSASCKPHGRRQEMITALVPLSSQQIGHYSWVSVWKSFNRKGDKQSGGCEVLLKWPWRELYLNLLASRWGKSDGDHKPVIIHHMYLIWDIWISC